MEVCETLARNQIRIILAGLTGFHAVLGAMVILEDALLKIAQILELFHVKEIS